MIMIGKADCTGCSACSFICPTNAIEMIEDVEGFLFPKVKKSLCVDCKACNSVCPFLNRDVKTAEKTCYAVQLNDEKQLSECASGGAFFGIGSQMIREGGCVFGVKDNGRNLQYCKATTIEELKLLTKSKYYQCTISKNVFNEIVSSSQNGKVLLSGTPCMISAFNNIDKINKDNVITFEIICQGVPSRKVIDRFYSEKESLYQSKIISHDFRSKDKYVGRNYLNKYVFQHGKALYYVGEDDDLSLSFQRQIFLRESCYTCKYANEKRVADFTGGDLWDYPLKSKIDIKNGCSVLICNTRKANDYITYCDTLIFEKIDERDALRNNIPYHHSVKRPKARDISYRLLNTSFSPKTITRVCCSKYYIKKLLKRK